MPHRRHNNFDDEYTLVLSPRQRPSAGLLKSGLKQSRSVQARGSPRSNAPRAGPVRPYPPSSAQVERVPHQIHDTSREGDLRAAFGIDGIVGRMVARILLLLVLFQPIYVAFGMELGDAASSEQGVVSSVENDAETTNEQSTETNAQDAMSSTENAADMANVTDGDGADPVTTTSSDRADAGPIDTDESATNADEDAATSTVPDTQSEIPADEASKEEEGAEGATSTDSVTSDIDENATEESNEGTEASTEIETQTNTASSSEASATSTEEETMEPVLPPAPLAHSTSSYTFGVGDCTLVANGEFYCIAASADRVVNGDPRVYAEKDREGDREIYYFDGVEVHRITNNGYDDFAPVFDEDTKRIAWNAMIQDRTQVMLHDIQTQTTRQVTQSSNTAGTPHLFHDSLVWQEWVDTNWEVFRADADALAAGADASAERLTDNVVHDMFPRAYEGLITWQREKGHSWEVVVYDLRTQKEHALEKEEDTKYENPRFVLLFDSRHENGDVETVGYDLDSGEMMELGTKPRSIPAHPQTPRDETEDALPSVSPMNSVKPLRDDAEGTDEL